MLAEGNNAVSRFGFPAEDYPDAAPPLKHTGLVAKQLTPTLILP